MPTFASTAMNAVPTLLLRSPLHRAVSGRYLLLTFTGRKTGREYTTPVAYIQDGNRIIVSTDSAWARNVIGGRGVRTRVRGCDHSGVGQRVTDPAVRVPAMRALLAIPGYARAAGIERIGGTITEEQIRHAAAVRTVIAIDLDDAS